MVIAMPISGHRHVGVVKFGVDDKSGGSINRVLNIVPIQRCRADMGRIARKCRDRTCKDGRTGYLSTTRRR